MNPLIIYGASGFGREVAWLSESCGRTVVCFADDDSAKHGGSMNGFAVMGLQEAGKRFPEASVALGVGDPRLRELMAGKCEDAGFSFDILVHPRVEKSRWIEVGEGAVVCAGNILTTNIRMGKHVQINLDCTVGHDVVMEDFATLAPGVHVSGWVHLGKRTYVGTGAMIVNGTEEDPLVIGDDAVIGAGACVTRSVPAGETWGGYPPSFCEERKNEKDRFSGWQYPQIDEGRLTRYNWMVQHKDNLHLGYKTDIGAFTYINAKYGVVIEDYVQIGSHCSIYSVSTIDDKKGGVVLQRNCRIGTHSTIMPGVTVGENAVVGAHSFVNRDIPAGTVAAGIPAKRMDSRRRKR